MKICSVGTELFRASGRMEGWTDEQTDMKKLIVTFHNLANMPINKGCVFDDLDNKYYQANSYNSSCHTDYSIHEYEAY